MKKATVTVKAVLCVMAVLMAAGCAVPLGENFSVSRETAQNGIYIVDYNLQTYVPVPFKGEQAVTSAIRGDVGVAVTWMKGTNTVIENLQTFEEDTVYSAKIELTPMEGYIFNPVIKFAYQPGRVASQDDDTKSPVRTVLVTYRNSNEEVPVTEYNLQSYVPVPVDGEKAVTEFTDDTRGVKGTVQWNPAGPAASILNRAATVERSEWPFLEGEEYTANIIMEALPGWYFTENDFIYPDGLVKTQPASSRDPKKRDLSPVGFNVTVINIFLPPTPGGGGGGGGGGGDPNTPGGGTNPDPNNPASYVIALDNYISAPSVGGTPTSGGRIDQYHLGVAVAWSPNDAAFADKAYTANVTLTADPSYTLGRVTGFTYKGTSLPFTFENNGAGAKLVINFPKPGIGGGGGSKNLTVDLTGTITLPKTDADVDFIFHRHGGLRYDGTVSWTYGYADVSLTKDNYKTEIANTSGTGTGWIPVNSPAATFIGGKVYRAKAALTTPDEGWFNEVKEFEFTSNDRWVKVWAISFTTSDGGNKAEVTIDFNQLTTSVGVDTPDE